MKANIIPVQWYPHLQIILYVAPLEKFDGADGPNSNCWFKELRVTVGSLHEPKGYKYMCIHGLVKEMHKRLDNEVKILIISENSKTRTNSTFVYKVQQK